MNNKPERTLKPYLSPYGAWAFALGTSIGWGSLVITSNTYLMQAGPLGSTLGMVLGGVIMMLIAWNYAYMMNCYPEAGGAYAYSREVFGYDQGFLTAWFLLLTYFAVLWANATSLPLFARYFIGEVFEFAKLYTVFGYDVYLGEALLSIAALMVTAFFLTKSKKTAARLMTVMVALFFLGITICFVYGLIKKSGSMEPAFVPDSGSLEQIIKIAVISPWAFIGFENISHLAEEFSFKKTKSFRVLFMAVLTTTALYVFITLLSVTAYPPEYSSWLEYIRDLGNLEGIKALPAFYAAGTYLGNAGIAILMISLLALIITSLIGNMTALSRLIFALGRDKVAAETFGELNHKGIPSKAIILIAAVSLVVPFLGRTAIGWIVDVTTIGATIIYGFVSASAYRLAGKRGDRAERITGFMGLAIMAGFGLYLLIPNLFAKGSLETESYFIFVIWAILGFIVFRMILGRDKRFGNTIVVWIGLLSLILFISLIWMSQTIMESTTRAMSEVTGYLGADPSELEGTGFIADELTLMRVTIAKDILVVMILFGVALGVLLSNYVLINKRVRESEMELGQMKNLANRDPLTGVKSKHAYTVKEEELNERITEGGMEDFAVAVCDVNGLKFVNDTYGHKAGDEYIRKASHIICITFQHSPVFRIGGDEFAVIMTGHDFENRHELKAEFDRIAEENISKNEAVVSLGISDYSREKDTSLHEVFERADALMYKRKQELKTMGAATR